MSFCSLEKIFVISLDIFSTPLILSHAYWTTIIWLYAVFRLSLGILSFSNFSSFFFSFYVSKMIPNSISLISQILLFDPLWYLYLLSLLKYCLIHFSISRFLFNFVKLLPYFWKVSIIILNHLSISSWSLLSLLKISKLKSSTIWKPKFLDYWFMS